MRVALTISLALHVAIIVMAVARLSGPKPLPAPPQEALPVEIVSIEDMARRATVRKEAPKEPPKARPAPPKPKETPKEVKKPAPKPAKEVRKAAPKPAPAPAPEKNKLEALVKEVAKAPDPEVAPKKVERKAAPKPRVRPRPRPKVVKRPKPKPQEPRKVAQKPKKPARKPPNQRDAIDEIAALLNKIDEPETAPRQPVRQPGQALRGTRNIDGDDARIAADIADALRARIEECWNVPAGVRDAHELRVKVRFQLGAGGKVAGGPVVLNSMAHPAFAAAAQSALRAILACQPYDFLPPDRYDLWRDVILNFDPSRMLAVN